MFRISRLDIQTLFGPVQLEKPISEWCMKIFRLLLAVAAVFVGSGFARFHNETKSAEDPKPIKAVMKEAMKSGLAKKVAGGEATDEEKMQVLNLLIDLVENEAPKGDETEWKMMAGTAMMNAAKVVVGREGAEEALGAAIDCKSCHDKFK